VSYKNNNKKPSNNDSTSTKDDSPFFVGKGGGDLSLYLMRQKLITKDTEMSVGDPCFFCYQSIKSLADQKTKNIRRQTHMMMAPHTQPSLPSQLSNSVTT
jgi:hypothetical protein